MKKLFFISFLISCITFQVSSQIVQEKGVVSLLSHKSITGIIDYSVNTPNILFLVDSIGNKQKLPLTGIKYVNTSAGEKFIPVKIAMTKDSSTVLAQVLIESGKINLYYVDMSISGGWFVSKNGKLYKLENEKSITNIDGKSYSKYNNKYIGILHILMNDRPDLWPLIDKTKFNYNDISKIILKYDGNDVQYHFNSTKKNKPNFIAFLHYFNYGSLGYVQNDKPSFGYSAGIQIYFKKQSRSSIRIDFNHSKHYQPDEIEYIIDNIEIWYQYDYFRSKKLILFLDLNFFSFGRLTKYEKDNEEHDNFFLLKVEPGTGIEYRPFSRFSIFAELNNLLITKALPKNFSFGLKYDFGLKGW